MEYQPSWERELDTLVRSSLVVDPPSDVQRSILAAVLQATAVPAQATALPVGPIAAPAVGRPIPLLAYLLLAAVLVAYAAALSWVQGLLGGGGWLSTLVAQLLTALDLVVGPTATGEPLALVWLLFQRAPWIALLPLAWLLWERDRAAQTAS
jgi:hypothetical protein